MRTTLDINDELLRDAKARAAEEGKPLRRIVEEALRTLMHTPAPGRRGYRLQWRPEKGRLLAGVRLDDRRSLLDLLDDHE